MPRKFPFNSKILTLINFNALNWQFKANTRQVGEVVTLDLMKSAKGLGFTINSRDTVTTGVSPLLINRILPGGAAIMSDLRIGDR